MALTQISTAGVKDDAVTAGKIPANAVGSSELADNAVDTAAIQGNAVTSGKLADGAVTNGKLGSEVVTNIKVADNAINEQKLQVSNSPSNGYFLSAQSGNTGGLTWAQVSGTTINNNAANRVITGSGTANTLEGNSNFTYTGSVISHSNPSGLAKLEVKGGVSGGALGASITLRNTDAANNSLTDIQFLDAGSNTYGKIQGTSLTDGSNNGFLSFFTASATSGLTERVRVGDSGNVGIGLTNPTGKLAVSDGTVVGEINPFSGSSACFIGTRSNHDVILKCNAQEKVRVRTGGGLTFNGDTAAANALDDYEEGTWTITVSPGGGSYTVSHMKARYTKIGNVVTVQGWWRTSALNSISGSLTISGFPFASFDDGTGGGMRQRLVLNVAQVNYSNLAMVHLRLGNNSTQGSILATETGAAAGLNTWTAGNIKVATELYISGSYLAA